MKLRPYQDEAVLAALNSIYKNEKAIIKAPTGSGKSIILSEIARRFIDADFMARVLVLTHQKELLEQNADKMRKLCPSLETGFFCTGINPHHDTTSQVIFASSQSLGRNPQKAGEFHLIIVDEVHRVNLNIEGDKVQYKRIFEANRDAKVIGLTATPYHKDTLMYGVDKFFTKLCFEISHKFLFENNYIVPFVLPNRRHDIIKADKIALSNTGDFVVKELTERSSAKDIIEKCLSTWHTEAHDRKLSLFFCCSVAHANAVIDVFKEKYPDLNCAYIDSETSKEDRADILNKAKQGYYKALFNVSVLTTGIDITNIDCIVMLRATKSLTLFSQSIGRGMRLNEGKKNFLLLDMAENLWRFGSDLDNQSVTARKVSAARKEEERKKTAHKKCPDCGMECAPSTMQCFCGHLFINHGEAALYSNEIAEGWIKPDMVKVDTNYSSKDGVKKVHYVFKVGKSITGAIRYSNLYLPYSNANTPAWLVQKNMKLKAILLQALEQKIPAELHGWVKLPIAVKLNGKNPNFVDDVVMDHR